MIVNLTYEYKNKKYEVKTEIKDIMDEEQLKYLFEDGNYSDDSTRADLIRNKYGNDAIPELPIDSEEIELINIEFED